MDGFYEVFYGGESVGKLQLIPQGLYLHIICRCHLPGKQIYKLYAVMEHHRENLGVVIPDGDGGILQKKIPAKYLREERLRFIISAGTEDLQGKFIPICPEEPFYYIDRLKNSFLELENGRIGIRITENPEAV